MKWNRIVLIVALFGIIEGQAQESFNLKSCLDYALSNNYDLLKAQIQQESINYQIKEQMSSGLPQIGGYTSFSDNVLIPTQLVPGEFFGGAPGTFLPVKFGVHYSVAAGLELNQLLFSQQFFNGLKAAKKAKEVVDVSVNQAKEQIVYTVANYYYQAQAYKIQLNMLEDNYDRLSKITDIAEVQFKNDMLRKLDLDQLIVNKKNLETTLNNARIAYNQQMNGLKIILGMDAEEELVLVDEAIQVNENEYESIKKIANNLSQKALQAKLEMSELEYATIKAGYYPSLHLNFSTSINGQFDKFNFKNEGSFNRYPFMMLGLTLNVPIFDGLKRNNQLKQKKLAMEQLKFDQLKTNQQLNLQYQNAVYSIQQNRSIYSLQKDNLGFANQLYDAVKHTYNDGMANITELINAENSLKEAQNNYLNALVKIKIAELDEMYISGNINELTQ
ncbi:MAG: TolC family protein [Chitinophagales bacterium]|nr:TolC family protein [Chitinophagales bacterium]MCZ2394284.1 TolC family protein [Chitinophagales bacterium]